MQHRQGNALGTAIVTYLIFVVIFAVFDPFHNSGLWVYGMSAVATGLCATRMNETAKKSAPKKPVDLAAAFRAGKESAVPKKLPARVAPRVNPQLARAQRVWAMEKDLGIEPWPIFGYDPPAPPPVITRRPKVPITLAEVAKAEKPEPPVSQKGMADGRGPAPARAPQPRRPTKTGQSISPANAA